MCYLLFPLILPTYCCYSAPVISTYLFIINILCSINQLYMILRIHLESSLYFATLWFSFSSLHNLFVIVVGCFCLQSLQILFGVRILSYYTFIIIPICTHHLIFLYNFLFFLTSHTWLYIRFYQIILVIW